MQALTSRCVLVFWALTRVHGRCVPSGSKPTGTGCLPALVGSRGQPGSGRSADRRLRIFCSLARCPGLRLALMALFGLYLGGN